MFGTTKDNKTNRSRDGVEIQDIIDALLKPMLIIERNKVNGNSHLYRGTKAEVSVNVDTGKLIQTNPTSSYKVK